MDVIDLRSDTVTLPSQPMRDAMARAPVGDDQYGEDPSVNLLQERVAAMLGKEAALYMPSGTMVNQVALKVFTRHGDDVIVGRQSHAVFHEAGGSAANAGVQFTEVGTTGLFTADDFRTAYKAPGHAIFPPTTLVEIENTHNRGGGLIFPAADVKAICDAARSLNVATYLDGARIFNTAAATGASLESLAQPFDMVGVALSKGLGAPVGSMLAGRKADIAKAVRARRMFGGSMRQAGIIAAAGLYAIEHNMARLPEDHANARIIAEKIVNCAGIRVDLANVKTNIVVFYLTDPKLVAAKIVEECKKNGVLLIAFSDRMIRFVTHLNVDAAACRRAGDVIATAITAK